MARARNIKPGFFRNEVLAECSAMARLLFIGLWCEADREGRLEYRPKRLKAAILPYDDACSMHDLIMELVQKGFVRLYKVGADEYMEVCNFLKHQQPHHKEVASVIPPPEQADSHAQAKHEPSITQDCPKQSAPCPTDSLIPHPSSLNRIPDSSVAPGKPVAPTTPAWLAYAEAYELRHGAPPNRTAKANALLKQFLSLVPAADAPAVAANYVSDNSAFYVTRRHPLELLVKDAQKLHTDWLTGQRINAQTARAQERTAANPFVQIAHERRQMEAIGHDE